MKNLFLGLSLVFTFSALAETTLNCSYRISGQFTDSDGKVANANASAENIVLANNSYSTDVQTFDGMGNPAKKYAIYLEAYTINAVSQHLKLSVVDYSNSEYTLGRILASTLGVFSPEQKEFSSQSIFPQGNLILNCTRNN